MIIIVVVIMAVAAVVAEGTFWLALSLCSEKLYGHDC